MKHIQLLGIAYVAGVRRSPDDGVISCSNDEAERLIAAGTAEDCSDDFADPDADSPEVPAVETAVSETGTAADPKPAKAK